MKQILALTLILLPMPSLAAELPIRHVILYKHGAGYFQRSGQLAPGESARLDFNASEMNDVLKSLTIAEDGGGKISGLRYDSSEPLERKLSNYPFRLGPGQPLSAVLDQLKGAILELKFGNETVRGALFSARVVQHDEKKPETEQVSLLFDSGEMRNFDLAAANSIRFIDPVLQAQFKAYLGDLVAARSKNKRSVYIDSTGSQARQISAEYIVPMPVWKSSYRLIWQANGEPMLEGWAIVDNTTSEDWTGVTLSLVSGRPISFISRLYEPRYLSRPTAELPEERAQAPMVYQGAIESTGTSIAGTVRDVTGAVIPRARITIRNVQTGGTQTVTADGAGHYLAQLEAGTYDVWAELSGFQRAYRRIEVGVGRSATADLTLQVGGVAQSLAAPGVPPPPPPSERIRVNEQARRALSEQDIEPSTVAAPAAAQELGELFEYRFSTPVTIRKNESGMLPFLQQKVSARKLLVYSDPSSVHPLHSAEITNNTGKTLDGGPITVYEDNAYAGEALVETLKTGDKRLISYGLDLGTRVTTQFDSKADIVREVHMRRGILTTKTAAVETKTYTARNVDKKPKTLIVEHPVRPQYKVTDQKPIETTPNAYRFEIKLAADATEKLPITEERVYESTSAVTNINPDVLVSYVQNKNISDAARAQLQQILDRKRQIASADGEIHRIEEQIRGVFQDQERLRQNLNSLNRVSGQEQQVQNYARQLSAQEAQLASLRDRQSEQQKRKTSLEAELNSLIEKMDF